MGAQLLQAYGAFSVARGPSSVLDTLAVEGAYVQAMPSARFLTLTSGNIDVRTLATSDASTWPLDPQGDAVGIVHFYAPITPDWQSALAARGLSVLLYVPTDALLVRGPPAAIASLNALPYVDYVGPYESAWKMPTGLAAASGIQDVRIVVMPGEPTGALEAWLARAGVPPRVTDPAAAGLVGAFGSGDFQWVQARMPSTLLPALAALPSVQYIDPVVPIVTQDYTTDWVLQTNVSGSTRYWTANLNGSGQVIGIADTGLDYDGAQFRQSASQVVKSGGPCNGDLYNCTDATRRKVVRYLDEGVLTGQLTWPGGGGLWDPYSIMDCAYNGAANGHGTAVASTLAGNAIGINGTETDNGNALAAQIYMEDIGGLSPGTSCGSGENLIYIPQDYANLFGPPGLGYNDPVAPVRIQSDSWGSAGDAYDVQAWMVDAFVWSHPDFTALFAAGNEGPTAKTIDSPGTAKDVLTVGGACNPSVQLGCPGGPNDLAPFSSVGPTLDGRIKPDIVTLAGGVSATSSGNAFDCPVYTNTNPACVVADHAWAGTSYATPAAAALAAIIRQYFTQGWYPSRAPVAADAFDPSAALMRAMLIASGQQLTGAGTAASTWPNSQQGFGRALLSGVLPLPGDAIDTEIVDNHAGLLTGQAMTYTFHVASGAPSVRFVLAWTDYPGTLGAAKALVNDLDLEVVAPDGTVYRGNNFGSFAAGQSVPGGVFDTTNPEEAVLLKSPKAGNWTVRVIGANVPVGPQPFALVATGGLDPNYGRLVLDKASYSENDTIHITLYDANAASATVHVTSSLETGGENVTLTQAAPGAPWTGSIATAFGQPAPDGILEVRDGDTITVSYQDANPAPYKAVATATVDATPAAVYGVLADQVESASAEIRWSSDLPADSRVEYGTSVGSLTSVASDPRLLTAHALALMGLQADTVYYYEVVSTDALGHVTRDTNGGRYYTFRTAPWGDVLLVIGDATFPVEREASYAAALDAYGWTWSVWHVADLGLPPLSVLQGRRAVLWQVGLEEYPTFNATAQGLIKAYLDGGGRLLVFSHDTSWSLGATDSPWYNPANVAWLQGVLKASFVCDPTTITGVVGVSGNPVSGAYTTGVPYTPHRTGGADDEIAAANVGGTSGVAWHDSGVSGCTGGAPIGLQWVSSAANGTTGVGAWGGTPSRLEYFAWEITSLDTNTTDLRPYSPVRAQILDNALRWLVGVSTSTLDRDHPAVNLTTPTGGTFAGPTIRITWTASVFGPGIGPGSFALAYSPDAGQTWFDVATVPGTARSANWTVTGLLNGDAYLLRILAADNGTPSLTGEAVSAHPFALDRPGGYFLGPVIQAGSLRLHPDPPGAAALVQFNATADATRSGGNPVAGAEMFWSTTPPTDPNGTGLPLVARDGSFDTAVENVTWNGPLAIAPGRSCAWVHAEDAAGNWGPFNVTCFVVIYTGPDVVPPAPAVLSSVLLANGNADLQITWKKAWDDSMYGGTVRYRVWRASAAAGPYTLVSGNITATDAASYTFVDPGRGAGDPGSDFYRVETIDAANNTEITPAVAAKAWLPVASGLNLLGMPVDPGPASLDTLANGVPWSEAFTYDACSGTFAWTRITPAEGPTSYLPAGQGFWFNATAPGTMLMLGVAQQVASLRLCAGWNLIALPGFPSTVTVGSLKAATGADLVMGFNPTDLYHLQTLPDTALLAPGEGVWVRVPRPVVWTVAAW